jgi:hypothetical protein
VDDGKDIDVLAVDLIDHSIVVVWKDLASAGDHPTPTSIRK